MNQTFSKMSFILVVIELINHQYPVFYHYGCNLGMIVVRWVDGLNQLPSSTDKNQSHWDRITWSDHFKSRKHFLEQVICKPWKGCNKKDSTIRFTAGSCYEIIWSYTKSNSFGIKYKEFITLLDVMNHDCTIVPHLLDFLNHNCTIVPHL